MKKRTVEAFVVIGINGRDIKYFNPAQLFTGNLAIFETKKCAQLAVEYNQKLEKNNKGSKNKYKIIICKIIY